MPDKHLQNIRESGLLGTSAMVMAAMYVIFLAVPAAVSALEISNLPQKC